MGGGSWHGFASSVSGSIDARACPLRLGSPVPTPALHWSQRSAPADLPRAGCRSRPATATRGRGGPAAARAAREALAVACGPHDRNIAALPVRRGEGVARRARRFAAPRCRAVCAGTAWGGWRSRRARLGYLSLDRGTARSRPRGARIRIVAASPRPARVCYISTSDGRPAPRDDERWRSPLACVIAQHGVVVEHEESVIGADYVIDLAPARARTADAVALRARHVSRRAKTSLTGLVMRCGGERPAGRAARWRRRSPLRVDAHASQPARPHVEFRSGASSATGVRLGK